VILLSNNDICNASSFSLDHTQHGFLDIFIPELTFWKHFHVFLNVGLVASSCSILIHFLKEIDSMIGIFFPSLDFLIMEHFTLAQSNRTKKMQSLHYWCSRHFQTSSSPCVFISYTPFPSFSPSLRFLHSKRCSLLLHFTTHINFVLIPLQVNFTSISSLRTSKPLHKRDNLN